MNHPIIKKYGRLLFVVVVGLVALGAVALGHHFKAQAATPTVVKSAPTLTTPSEPEEPAQPLNCPKPTDLPDWNQASPQGACAACDLDNLTPLLAASKNELSQSIYDQYVTNYAKDNCGTPAAITDF